MFRRAQAARQVYNSSRSAFSTRTTFAGKQFNYSKAFAACFVTAGASAYMYKKKFAVPSLFQMTMPAACAAAY